MAEEYIKKFERDNTVYFECYYKTLDMLLADPTSPGYTILDIRGNVVATGTPVRVSTGFYYVYWTPTVVGSYIIEFTGSVSTNQVRMRRKFRVTKTGWKGEWSSSSSSCSSSSSSESSSSCSSCSSCSSSYSSCSSSSSSSCSSSSCSSSSSFSSSSSSFSSSSSCSSSFSSSSSSA